MNKPSYLTAVRSDNEILQPATKGDLELLRLAIRNDLLYGAFVALIVLSLLATMGLFLLVNLIKLF